VHLPAPATVYPVVPFEHTVGSHANASASDHLLADHINGLSVSSRRQRGIILKKWRTFLEVVGIQRTPELVRGPRRVGLYFLRIFGEYRLTYFLWFAYPVVTIPYRCFWLVIPEVINFLASSRNWFFSQRPQNRL
jgi:hypothetical protein